MSQQIFEYILKALPGCADADAAVADNTANGDRPPWVLHVEDDADFSAALKTRLEAHGVAVVRAFDGMDGMRHAAKYPADAILLDVEMPNGSGDEVLQMLKSDERTQAIPVVVLTCRSDRAIRRKMLQLGAAAFLTKPIRFDELHRELSRHISILSHNSRNEIFAPSVA